MITNHRNKEHPHCPVCGEGELRAVTRTERFEHETEDGPVMVVAHNVPVEVCSNCAEVFSGPEAGRIRDEAIFRAQGPRTATEETSLTAAEIVQLRERLGFSQAEFAAFTGIGEASLSRWERGLLIPSKAHNRYLRLIRENEDNVRLLQVISGITPPAPRTTAAAHPLGQCPER